MIKTPDNNNVVTAMVNRGIKSILMYVKSSECLVARFLLNIPHHTADYVVSL